VGGNTSISPAARRARTSTGRAQVCPARQHDEAARVERHVGLLPGFAGGGVAGRGEGVARPLGVDVAGVDAAAGEHPRAAGEVELGVAPQHQRLEALDPVAQQHHGRRRHRVDPVAAGYGASRLCIHRRSLPSAAAGGQNGPPRPPGEVSSSMTAGDSADPARPPVVVDPAGGTGFDVLGCISCL
jgi:hypothetical protein